MGKIEIAKIPFFVIVLVAITIGISIGAVSAVDTTTTHTGNVIIEKSEVGTGKLSVLDQNLGIRTTAGGQLIKALRDDGLVGSFRVEGTNGSPIFFSLRSDGGAPNLLFSDTDVGQTYLFRIAQPSSGTFEFRDQTAGANRMTFATNGDVCIGAC